MKRFTGVLLLLFLSFGCTKEERFDAFEISYNDGWTTLFSFSLHKEGTFTYQVYDISKTGKLNPQQFENFSREIVALKNGKLKSYTYDCIDCPAVSLWIKSGNDTLHIQQKGGTDKLIRPIINSIIKILLMENKDYKQQVNYTTRKDLIPPPPSAPITE